MPRSANQPPSPDPASAASGSKPMSAADSTQLFNRISLALAKQDTFLQNIRAKYNHSGRAKQQEKQHNTSSDETAGQQTTTLPAPGPEAQKARAKHQRPAEEKADFSDLGAEIALLPPNAGIGSTVVAPAAATSNSRAGGGAAGDDADARLRAKLLGRRRRGDGVAAAGAGAKRAREGGTGTQAGAGGGGGRKGEESESDEEEGRSGLGRMKRRKKPAEDG